MEMKIESWARGYEWAHAGNELKCSDKKDNEWFVKGYKYYAKKSGRGRYV